MRGLPYEVKTLVQKAREPFTKGACFHSLAHDAPARIDFYRARVVDGLGQVMHERLFAVEVAESGEPRLREPSVLSDFTPAPQPPASLPPIASAPQVSDWLYDNVLPVHHGVILPFVCGY